MNKMSVIAAGGAAVCASVAFLTCGVASADPDVVGKKYSDAKAELQQANLRPVVATVVGDRLPQSQCYVTGTTQATFLDQGGGSKGDIVNVHLNCYPKTASAENPGFSAGNLGKDAEAVRATHDEEVKEWQEGPKGQKYCQDAAVEHPDWAPISWCNY
jgi:hypothetical protein